MQSAALDFTAHIACMCAVVCVINRIVTETTAPVAAVHVAAGAPSVSKVINLNFR